MHPAIKAHIEYWSQLTYLSALADYPPFHVTYYCVDEGGTLRVYGVKWQGADLSKGEVFTPENEHDLLANAIRGQRNKIGDGFTMGDRLMTVDCYVLDSPLRRTPGWTPSVASSLLHERRVTPQSYSFRLDKKKWGVRFIDETEDSVTVLVEPK